MQKKILTIGRHIVSYKGFEKIQKKGLIADVVIIDDEAAATVVKIKNFSAKYLANELLKMDSDEIDAYFAVNAYNYQKDEHNYLDKINKALNILIKKYSSLETKSDIKNYKRVFKLFDII